MKTGGRQEFIHHTFYATLFPALTVTKKGKITLVRGNKIEIAFPDFIFYLHLEI